VCSGGLGVGEKELVRDWLSVIAQVVARGGMPPLVAAAAPRGLRIDPCEKKSKRHELRRAGEKRSVGTRWSCSHSVVTF